MKPPGPLPPQPAISSSIVEYDITLKSHADLDGFYADMKSNGYKMTLRRPISRTTAYEMNGSQAEEIKKDPRVLDVEVKDPPNLVIKLDGTVNYHPEIITAHFSKEPTTGTGSGYAEDSDYCWSKLHTAGTNAQRRYGQPNQTGTFWNNSNPSVEDTVKIFNNGKHVDIIIVDTLCPYDMGEWYSTENPSQNRFVQEDWFANYNSMVIGGLDQDGYSSPGTNYTYGYNGQNSSGYTYHANHVMSTAGGKHYGWAKEANLYSINVLYTGGAQPKIDRHLVFDYIRAFHRSKPINNYTGHKNPTIVNCSWGWHYDFSSTYPEGVENSTDIIGGWYCGNYYDDGIRPWDDIDGVGTGTTPMGYTPGLTGWNSTQWKRIYGIRGSEFPYNSTAMRQNVSDCLEEGIVIVRSAGNDSLPICMDPYLGPGDVYYDNRRLWSSFFTLGDPSPHKGNYYYCRPGSPHAPGVITVSAITSTVNWTSSLPPHPVGSTPANYSNRGMGTHVFAPGNNILAGYVDSTYSGAQPDTKYGGLNNFAHMSGTSMASPNVAGVLACRATGEPRFTASDAKKYIDETSVEEMFVDQWAQQYTSVTAKQMTMNCAYFSDRFELNGTDRVDVAVNESSWFIGICALDTLTITPNSQHPVHTWYLSTKSACGVTGVDVTDAAQWPYLVSGSNITGQGATGTNASIVWTPTLDQVGDYYLICGDTSSSHVSSHHPPQNHDDHDIMISVYSPWVWDDMMAGGQASNKLLQARNTREEKIKGITTSINPSEHRYKGHRFGYGVPLESKHIGPDVGLRYIGVQNSKKYTEVDTVGGWHEQFYPRSTTLQSTVQSDTAQGYNSLGESVYSTAGTHSWVAPAGVTSVGVVAVGGGGAGGPDGHSTAGGAGGGGGLGWKNNISVTPGQSYTVVVGAVGVGGTKDDGGDSYFINDTTVCGRGGKGTDMTSGQGIGEYGGYGGSFVGDGGGQGGRGGEANTGSYEGGGAGAGGYSSTGGNGGGGTGYQTPSEGNPGQDGSGGGGGGGQYGGGFVGGGTSLYGQGINGTGGNMNNGTRGSDPDGTISSWPGGGGSGAGATGGDGGVRIMWGGSRTFPHNAWRHV